MNPKDEMIFNQLTQQDSLDVYQLFQENSLDGVHKPSYYTLSSIVQLYGEICGAIRSNGVLKAVCLSLPCLGEKAVFIYAFTVKSGDQRKGFGRYLFADLASTLKKADYEKISLRVLKTNIAAYQFWQSMGFTEAPGKILDSKDEFAEYYMEVVL